MSRTGKSNNAILGNINNNLPVQLQRVTVLQYVTANLRPCRTCSAVQRLAEVVVLHANKQLLQKLAFYISLISSVAQEEVDPACYSACGKLDKSKLSGTALKIDHTQCLVQQAQ